MLFLFIIIIILILLVFVSSYFSSLVVRPKVWKYEDTYKCELDAKKIVKEEFESWEKEEFTIKSQYGYDLHAMFFPTKDSTKTIIFCHGFTFSLYGSVKYMPIFLKRGFNVLIYDHRHHGLSGGPNVTGGYFEKYDLKTCTDWVFNRVGTASIVGIHGESLGAATALQNAAIDERISFYIADCPYSNFYELLKLRLKEDYHMPSFPVLILANLLTKLRTGASWKECSPILTIDKVNTPILFIHGEGDKYIPNTMSKDMYEAKKNGYKKIYIAPNNAGHAEAFWKNKEEYDKVVGDFLKEINIS